LLGINTVENTLLKSFHLSGHLCTYKTTTACCLIRIAYTMLGPTLLANSREANHHPNIFRL
jgi:hypothetical protein